MNNFLLDTKSDPNSATNCNPHKCLLPDCSCSKDGTQIPGNFSASSVPQMIIVTFDDAVNSENFDLYTSKNLKFKKKSNFFIIKKKDINEECKFLKKMKNILKDKDFIS